MRARRLDCAVASTAAWVAATCGLALGSAACTDGTTADCSDAQCQVVVDVADTGASAAAESGVDADADSSAAGEAAPDVGPAGPGDAREDVVDGGHSDAPTDGPTDAIAIADAGEAG